MSCDIAYLTHGLACHISHGICKRPTFLSKKKRNLFFLFVLVAQRYGAAKIFFTRFVVNAFD